ncbi:hypothetical protein OSTOST_06219 [Ostertagia ostertagi]
MDALVMASHGMLMRVEKCDDGKLLCAKIQANKITKKQYPGDINKEIRALELMKTKKVDNKFLPKLWGKGKTPDLTFYITDHVGQTLQRQLRRYKIRPNDTEQIGYPLDRYTPRAVHKGERAKPKHDLEMFIYLVCSGASFNIALIRY